MTDTTYTPRHRAVLRDVDAPSLAGRLHYTHVNVHGQALSRPIGTHRKPEGYGTCDRCGTTCTRVWPVPGEDRFRCEWCR